MCDLWVSYQIRKIAGCACAGNAGNVFSATDFKGNRELAIPACITARAWPLSAKKPMAQILQGVDHNRYPFNGDCYIEFVTKKKCPEDLLNHYSNYGCRSCGQYAYIIIWFRRNKYVVLHLLGILFVEIQLYFIEESLLETEMYISGNKISFVLAMSNAPWMPCHPAANNKSS